MKTPLPSDPFALRKQLLKCIFCSSQSMVDGFAALNPNEYPKAMDPGIAACADRYATTLMYARNTVLEVHRYRRAGFMEDLGTINQSLPLRRDALCELNCLGVRANFESSLFAAKALLDVLCRYLLGPRIGQNVDGFHKGKVNGAQTAGGRVLNSLANVSLATLPTRDYLANLVVEHKVKWIDGLIAMRDAVTHSGELSGFVGFWMMIEGGHTVPYTLADVHDPMLQLGQSTRKLEVYCTQLEVSVTDFTVRFRDALFPPEERDARLVRMQTAPR